MKLADCPGAIVIGSVEKPGSASPSVGPPMSLTTVIAVIVMAAVDVFLIATTGTAMVWPDGFFQLVRSCSVKLGIDVGHATVVVVVPAGAAETCVVVVAGEGGGTVVVVTVDEAGPTRRRTAWPRRIWVPPAGCWASTMVLLPAPFDVVTDTESPAARVVTATMVGRPTMLGTRTMALALSRWWWVASMPTVVPASRRSTATRAATTHGRRRALGANPASMAMSSGRPTRSSSSLSATSSSTGRSARASAMCSLISSTSWFRLAAGASPSAARS